MRTANPSVRTGTPGLSVRWPHASGFAYPPATLGALRQGLAKPHTCAPTSECLPPAADYDDRQSTLLDDYLSVLARFHFVWSAYEAVRRQSNAGQLLTSKLVGDRVTLAGRVPVAQLELLDRVYRASLSLANGDDKILEPLEKKDESLVVGKAGLLAAGFRNHIFHGHEAPPSPEDPSEQFRARLPGQEVTSIQAYRMVCFTRLTFHLIQVLTHGELHRGHEIDFGYVPFLPRLDYCEFGVPCGFVLNLATYWPEERSSELSSQVLKHLARGFDVSGAVLELIMESPYVAG